METARLIVERGGTVVIFPEGTRIRTGSLGRPKRGVGRLALETGRGGAPGRRPRHRAGPPRLADPPAQGAACAPARPMTFPRTERPSPALAATVTDRIWPNIELQWEWLGGLPPLRKAAVIGAGSWGTAVAVLLARGGLEVELGTRSEEKARQIARKRRERGVPARGEAPRGGHGQAHRARSSSPAATCLPRGALVGAAERRRRARRPDRLPRLGAAALEGPRPADGRAAERVRLRARARARDRLARRPGARPRGGGRDGRARARQRRRRPARACWARSSTAPAWSASAPTTSPGSRSPARPRTPPRSPPRPPSARAQRRRDRRRRRSGASASSSRSPRAARLETFSGLAGVGDLTATVLAPEEPQPPGRRAARRRACRRRRSRAGSARRRRGSTRCR